MAETKMPDLWHVMRMQNRAIRRLAVELNMIRRDQKIEDVVNAMDTNLGYLDELEKKGLGGTTGATHGAK